MSETPAAAPTSRDVAVLLAEIGTLMELNGSEPFRSRAFTNAARALEATDADILALARENRLTTLKGIGPAIAAVIGEYVLTGKSQYFEELRATTPLALYDLMRVPGLGARRIHTLHQELGVEDLDSLEEAVQSGRVAELPGFGERTAARILAGLDFARSNRQQRRYPEAIEVGERILVWLREQPRVIDAELAGTLRRRMEVVEVIDLVASSDHCDELLAAFRSLQGGHSPSGEGPDEASLRLSDGVTIRVRCVTPADFAATLAWETGSDTHLAELAGIAAARGFTFDADGFRRDGKRVRLRDEIQLYEKLGLSYVPPELREGLGELSLAAAGALPRLVESSDLTGTFHCHTTYSDGKATLEEMAAGARARGWSYLGIADHSRSAGYAGGLEIEAVKHQQEEIDDLNRAFAADGGPRFRLFKGIESDILSDGSLDYPPRVLRTFDYVVGSVHSGFRTPEAEMTRRIVRAVENSALTILGHPTGRLLLRRSGYPIDMRAVLRAAADSRVIVEINSHPNRLDLDWREVRVAASMGILIAINPDAHSVAALGHVNFGVNMARKAGLEARHILNCWPLDEIEDYFAQRKDGR